MQRPTSLTVLGILNIVFACFGFCGGLCGLGALAMMPMIADIIPPEARDEFVQNLEKSLPPEMQVYTYVQGGVGIVASIVLIIAGVALLKCRPIGRTLSIGWAAYGLLSIIVSVVMNAMFVWPNMADQPGGMAGAIGGTLFGSLIGAAYPIVLAYFMFRPNVVAALREEMTIEADRPAADDWHS